LREEEVADRLELEQDALDPIGEGHHRRAVGVELEDARLPP
jgi:hypothetical protein